MILKKAVEKLEKYIAAVDDTYKSKILVVGDEDIEIKGILTTFNVDENTIKVAEKNNSNLIITYGEFDSRKNSSLNSKLIKNDLAVISLKTDMDICANGFEGALVTSLGLQGNRVVDITFAENCYKLVVCVPKLEEDYTSRIRQELGRIGVEDGLLGAGYVGTYSEVSDYTIGYQWFVTMPGADPFIGNIGDLSKVEVERFEMIIPEHQLDVCVNKLWEIHPYEEVEYDVYPVMEKRNHKGHGRFGEFEKAVSAGTLIQKIKELTGAKKVFVALQEKEAKKIAVCSNLTLFLAEKLMKEDVDTIITNNVDITVVAWLKTNNINTISLNNFELKATCIKKTNDFISAEISNVTDSIVNPFISI